jgi:hypothetical protein
VSHDRGPVRGCRDIFAAKLISSGNRLLYSSLLGGNYCDFGNAIAIDAPGDAYVAGQAESHDVPTTAGVVQRHHLGGPAADATFVAKLSPDGSRLLCLSYLGGSIGDPEYPSHTGPGKF